MNIHIQSASSFYQMGQRTNQEDARYPDTDMPDMEQRFFLVCDGVGGSEAGEVASATVCSAFAKALQSIDLTETELTNVDFSMALNQAYEALNHADRKHHTDMATTMTFLALHKGGVMMAHIGDSRIYHIRLSSGIIYRSDDHSLVNQMVHSGIISPEEAEQHPQRNVITRYMAPTSPDQSRCTATVCRTRDVQEGDYFLLCSDGVMNCLDDEAMIALIRKHEAPADIMKEMAQQCIESSDNNTAILLQIGQVENDQAQPDNVEKVEDTEDSGSRDTRQSHAVDTGIEEVEASEGTKNKNNITNKLRSIFGMNKN